MSTPKPVPGEKLAPMQFPKLGGGVLEIGGTRENCTLFVVYRGKHCPICTKYLKQLNELKPQFNELGIDVVAVSGDPEEKAKIQLEQINPDFEVGYDLTIEQMQELGLYISDPRSPQETDKPFAEPGFFVINDEGKAQIIDISNAPFARPELESMLMGLKFIRNPENNYPVRGMHT
ncbi:MAG: peroxiredoxin-like family protein [Pseudomonadota bacterium]